MIPRIRRIVLPTIQTTVKRYNLYKTELGWIDMKFNPIDGSERDPVNDFYRKDRIYSWIQGRGLESLTAHIQWFDRIAGYFPEEKSRILAAAESLYRKIISVCFSDERPEAFFVMTPEGRVRPRGDAVPASEAVDEPSPLTRIDKEAADRATTLSHLFILRGLVAFASYRGYDKDLERIIPALRLSVDASIAGNCRNDQEKFAGSGGAAHSEERRGYEGQMIALGACDLLYMHTGESQDLERGASAIRTVMDNYLREFPGTGKVLVDALSPGGEPFRVKGEITANPGHAIEFAGLAFRFLRHANAKKQRLSAALPSRNPHARPILVPDSLDDLTGCIDDLRRLAIRSFRDHRTGFGGIARSVSAESGRILDGNCPWWSTFEAARTFAELYGSSVLEDEKLYCLKQIQSCLDCIQDAYIAPSTIGIPVQTLSSEGLVEPVIPATPDIDPGYHTGIPLLDVYEILGKECSLEFGSAETRIPACPGMPLQGHIARDSPAESEMDPLHVRAAWFTSPWSQALILSADVLEFSADWAERTCSALSREFRNPERKHHPRCHAHTHRSAGHRSSLYRS